MSKKFIRVTSGWIPVSMLILFAIALAAGQARARLQHESDASAVSSWQSVTTRSDRSDDDYPGPGRVVFEPLLPAPAEFEFRLNTRILSLKSIDAITAPSGWR